MSSRGIGHRDVPLAGAAAVDLDVQVQLLAASASAASSASASAVFFVGAMAILNFVGHGVAAQRRIVRHDRAKRTSKHAVATCQWNNKSG